MDDAVERVVDGDETFFIIEAGECMDGYYSENALVHNDVQTFDINRAPCTEFKIFSQLIFVAILSDS